MICVCVILVLCCLKAVSDGSHFALQDMSNAIKRSVMSTYLNVPEPLIASDSVAASMYPWRSFISRYVHTIDTVVTKASVYVTMNNHMYRLKTLPESLVYDVF